MPSTILISLGDLRQSETSGVSSSSGYFDPFPDEVIERVFLLLPPPDLISALRLNLRLNKVIRDSKKLQYYFTLQTSGLVDGNKAAPLCDKMMELRDREKAWRSVDLSRRLSVPMDHTVNHIYGLSGGILFCGKQSTTTNIPEFEHLKCLDLTTCDNESAVCKDSWHQMTIPGRIAGIGYALQEHDLIGIVGAEIEKIVLHLRQYSTGLPHPLAFQTEIPVAFVPYFGGLSVVIEISGPFVVLLLSQLGMRINDLLLLIHWRTGEIIIREEPPCETYFSFTLLTRNMLFLPNSYEKMFETVKIPNSVALGNGTGTSFRRLAFLHLRDLTGARFLRTQITCSADLIQSNEPHSDPYNERFYSDRWAASRQQSFSTDPDKTIVRIVIWAIETVDMSLINHTLATEVIVHRKTLIDIVNLHVANIDNLDPTDDFSNLAAEVVTVPLETWSQEPEGGIIRWDLWDTTGGRWRWRGKANFGQANFGQRIATAADSGSLLIKDFNHYAVKQALATLKRSELSDTDSDELFDIHWNAGPVRLNDHTLLRLVRQSLQEEVASIPTDKNKWLPYAETVTKLDEKCTRVLLDGERIVCVQENRFGLVAKLNIYTM